MSETWRLFVAVPIGEELRTALAGAVERWARRDDLAGLRWTDAAGWHVTLLFLGATDPGRVPAIVRTLQEAVAGHAPMRLVTGGLGGFPSARRARVAWYGVADPGRGLRSLADDVRRALAPEEPMRFRAHVTLARARDDVVDLTNWIAAADAPSGELNVEEIVLMRSHLGRGPAHYEELARIGLGVAVHG